MADLVLMPQMGISEESAILAQWNVKKNDKVQIGDILFTIETGKSAFDIESEFAGVVLEIIAEEGDEVLIKAPVCAIGAEGEVYEAVKEATTAPPVEEESAKPVAISQVAFTAEPIKAMGISPRARNLAVKAEVDTSLAAPTGPEGRIIERDIRALIEKGEVQKSVEEVSPVVKQTEGIPEAQYTDKPLSTIRKLIAKNMHDSLKNTAQLTHTASFDATAIMEYRKTLKTIPEFSGITLTDMILYAVTRTLPEFPELNAWMLENSMRYFNDVNLACAVDTERGLMVPVIFGASSKSLLEISGELKDLAGKCRNGAIATELLTGGSFTVSNLGAYGIESFTPILNAPQTGILGVNTITKRVKEVNGEIELYPCMTLSLTYDHRAVDGAPASRFLQTLCKNLENFTALLAR